MAEKSIEGVFRELSKGRCPVPLPAEGRSCVKFCVPEKSGVCVIFAKDPECFPGIKLSEEGIDRGLVYIGATGNLKGRLGDHFNAKHSGSSTLKHSIEVIFREERELFPISKKPSKKTDGDRVADFRFEEVSEVCLRDWMRSNLQYSLYQVDGPKKERENLKNELICRYGPPLNLKKGDSPYKGKIMALRSERKENP